MMNKGMKMHTSMLQKRTKLDVETRSDQKKKPTAIQKKITTIRKHSDSAEQIYLQSNS